MTSSGETSSSSANNAFGLGNAIQQAIVTGVHAAVGKAFLIGLNRRQQPLGEIQLISSRLSPGHIQLEILFLIVGILLGQLSIQLLQFCCRTLCVRFHIHIPCIFYIVKDVFCQIPPSIFLSFSTVSILSQNEFFSN